MESGTMSVRSGVVFGVVAVFGTMFCATVQAEDGRPSRDALAAMGLGSMTIMSDEEALAVRGHGYQGSSVSVFGSSFATINGGPNGGAHSENGYLANGKHHAKGSNSSYAGVATTTSGGHKPGGGNCRPSRCGNYGGGGGGGYGGIKVQSTVFFAGGHSSASAW